MVRLKDWIIAATLKNVCRFTRISSLKGNWQYFLILFVASLILNKYDKYLNLALDKVANEHFSLKQRQPVICLRSKINALLSVSLAFHHVNKILLQVKHKTALKCHTVIFQVFYFQQNYYNNYWGGASRAVSCFLLFPVELSSLRSTVQKAKCISINNQVMLSGNW